MALTTSKIDYRRRFVTVFDEMRVYDEFGEQGWELVRFGLWSTFVRPQDPSQREAWQYHRVVGQMLWAERSGLEKSWTYCGSWMGIYHYFKRPVSALENASAPKAIVLHDTYDFKDRFVTAFDEVGAYRELGNEGWELTGFGLVSRLRRPVDPAKRQRWEYLRLSGPMSDEKRMEVQREWTFVGGWMGTFHYFKRVAPATP